MNINTSPDLLNRSVVGARLGYMSGFGNSFETEALPGALPIGRNSPQRCAYGLYAEQLSGSPFTAPRGTNERSWLYRIRPSVKHSGRFAKADAGLWRTAPCHEFELPIAQLRWDPAPIPKGDKPGHVTARHGATWLDIILLLFLQLFLRNRDFIESSMGW